MSIGDALAVVFLEGMAGTLFWPVIATIIHWRTPAKAMAWSVAGALFFMWALYGAADPVWPKLFAAVVFSSVAYVVLNAIRALRQRNQADDRTQPLS